MGSVAIELRKSLNLTQLTMSQKLGISVDHLEKLEQGISPFTKDELEKYRKFCKVDLYAFSWVLHGDPNALPIGLRALVTELATRAKENIDKSIKSQIGSINDN